MPDHRPRLSFCTACDDRPECEALDYCRLRPWCTATMVCVVCGHESVNVYPAITTHLECGGCGHMNDAPPVSGPVEE